MSTDEAAPPTRRRDARENRERIVVAAREVFMSEGFDAPLDRIARRAGIGRATLYRNFPDRHALGSAIFEQNLQALEALAAEQDGRPDAFLTLLSAIVEQQVECHALVPALLTGPSAPDLQALARRITRTLAAPLRRAQAAGAIRPDFAPADILAVLAMVSAVVAGQASVRERRRRAARALELVLHGLYARAPADPRGRESAAGG